MKNTLALHSALVNKALEIPMYSFRNFFLRKINSDYKTGFAGYADPQAEIDRLGRIAKLAELYYDKRPSFFEMEERTKKTQP
ncbi:MAG: uncharacterized protein A8A55_0613 [Amphiamblys sp. WSBS2006]|nr:MAG: uncharacterized protein A8A55_0613 [Amphiamblys sp. WSBS2006]